MHITEKALKVALKKGVLQGKRTIIHERATDFLETEPLENSVYVLKEDSIVGTYELIKHAQQIDGPIAIILYTGRPWISWLAKMVNALPFNGASNKLKKYQLRSHVLATAIRQIFEKPGRRMELIYTSPRYQIGCVHGRFQPIHWDHLAYILRALVLSEHLLLGLVNPSGVGNSHRFAAESNPFSEGERKAMIFQALRKSGIPRDVWEFVKFPIDDVESLKSMGAPKVAAFVSIYNSWTRTKFTRIKEAGFTAVPIRVRECGIVKLHGRAVREIMRSGSNAWRLLVPF